MFSQETINSLLDKRQYISFDIFDTLILRPYVMPTDLFRHMELLFGDESFSEQRIDAEKRARRKKQREITLDEIYEELDEKFQRFKELEIEMEISLSIPNKELLELYCALKGEGKRTILISDMYLPYDVIRDMLNKCGITDYDGLYVSSKYGVTKHNGQLYDLAINDLGITKENLLHLGDNKHSDYIVPKRKGICSYLYKKPIDSYFKENKDKYRFYKNKRTLQRSIMVSMDMLICSKDTNWFNLGMRFGGPLATSYSLEINNERNSGHLFLYASRDGYNLKRISEKLFPDNSTHYIYAQRLLLDVFTEENLPYGKIELPSESSNKFQYRKKAVSMRRILSFYRRELKLTVPNDPKMIEKVYNERVDEIDDLRKKGLADYSNYLKSICGEETVDLVDCTTMKYSSQKLVETSLGRSVKGHYLVTLSEIEGYDHTAMCDWHSPAIGWMNIDIPEFFLCSPEYPLSGWCDGPIFDDSSEEERFRISVYNDVSDGELDYALRYRSIFGECMIPFDYWSVVKWSKLAAVRGTSYHNLLKEIKWASDPDHSDYAPLITNVGSIKGIIKKLFISIISKIND